MDGKEVAHEQIPHITPFVETIDETFDVGVDSRKSVELIRKRTTSAGPDRCGGKVAPAKCPGDEKQGHTKSLGLYCLYPAF